MRRYELVFVLAPSLTEEEVDQQIESYSSVAKELGAELIEVDAWGKRRLAFPVKKFNEGYYTVFTLEEPAATAIGELERRFKVSDSIIRFLSVRIDRDLKRAEKFETRRELRRKRRGKGRDTEPKRDAAPAEKE